MFRKNKEEKLVIFRSYQFPEEKKTDVIVAGGGVAGCAAALAAARQGCSVLLMERTCALGGLATIGLVNLFVPMCNGRGIPILRGMAEEFLRDAVKLGWNTLNDAWRTDSGEKSTNLRYATQFSAALFALQLREKLAQAGVSILFDCAVADVLQQPDGSTQGIVALCEEGLRFFPAERIVDATGSAAVFDRAGAKTVSGENYFSYHSYGITLANCEEAVRLREPRRVLSWRHGGNASLYGKNHPEGMPLFYGDTSAHISEYLSLNQQKLLDNLRALPRGDRETAVLPGMPQLRKVRRICGKTLMRESDLYRHFPDSVTAVCDSEKRDSLYEIPFGALIDPAFPALIAGGRIIAADGWVWDVTRVIPPAIVTGQAAGTAAALSLQQSSPITELSVPLLQQSLDAQNVLLHFRDEWIPANREPGEYAPASWSSPDFLKHQ